MPKKRMFRANFLTIQQIIYHNPNKISSPIYPTLPVRWKKRQSPYPSAVFNRGCSFLSGLQKLVKIRPAACRG